MARKIVADRHTKNSSQGPNLWFSQRPLAILSLGLAIALHVWWPVSLPYGWLLPDIGRYIVGGLLTVAGVSLIAAAVHPFYRSRENPTPASPSDKLFVEGCASSEPRRWRNR